MRWFESSLKYSELMECPLCHIRIRTKDDISINLEKVSRKDRNEMFDVIYNSEDILGWNQGFDKLDGEFLIKLIEDLTIRKRKELMDLFDGESTNRLIEFIDEHWEYDKELLWRETFKRLSKKKQNKIIEDYFECYEKVLKIQEKKYDWLSFKCNLLENNEISKLQMITRNWNELGMQVYGCRLSNQQLCPCLKESASGGTYKCFKTYLETHGLRPETDIPVNMRID